MNRHIELIPTQDYLVRNNYFFTFPTDGNPISATLASPDFITSKPSP